MGNQGFIWLGDVIRPTADNGCWALLESGLDRGQGDKGTERDWHFGKTEIARHRSTPFGG